jgi:hypothetical protein
LYFHLHAAAQKWLPHSEQVILWFQVLLTALAAGLLLLLLGLYFPLLLALIGTVISLAPGHTMMKKELLRLAEIMQGPPPE